MSKKNTILLTAAALFARKGFKETTMAEVSQLSGVASATVFYHFNNKEALLLAILEKVKTDIVQNFKDYRQEHRYENGYQTVLGAIAYYLHLAGEMEDEFLLLQRHFPYHLAVTNSVCRSYLEDIYNCWVDIFEQAIRLGGQDGSIGPLSSARKTALIIFATLDGIVRLNTFNLYDAGTLYQELLTACGRIMQAAPCAEG